MCSGGGGSYTATKSDPTPVQVTSADTGADQAEAIAKKKQRNRAKTNLSTDRAGSLLGSASSGGDSGNTGTVNNLGGVK